MEQVIAWILANKALLAFVLPLLYEAFIRLVPTAKNWSIFRILETIFDYLITNKSKGALPHSATDPEIQKERVGAENLEIKTEN